MVKFFNWILENNPSIDPLGGHLLWDPLDSLPQSSHSLGINGCPEGVCGSGSHYSLGHQEEPFDVQKLIGYSRQEFFHCCRESFPFPKSPCAEEENTNCSDCGWPVRGHVIHIH
jgi:hypothetical protein